jgi:hypothetical protein
VRQFDDTHSARRMETIDGASHAGASPRTDDLARLSHERCSRDGRRRGWTDLDEIAGMARSEFIQLRGRISSKRVPRARGW